MLHEETSEHVLNVAASMFVANGVRGAAVLQMCAAAGASVAVANCRFRMKARLYADVVRRLVDRFVSYFSSPSSASVTAVRIFDWRPPLRPPAAAEPRAASLPLRDAGYAALLEAAVDDAWNLMFGAADRFRADLPPAPDIRPEDSSGGPPTYEKRHPARRRTARSGVPRPIGARRQKEHYGDTSSWHGQLSAAEGRHERRHREVAGHDGRVDLLAHGHPLPACRDGR